MIKILYFARLSEQLGTKSETLEFTSERASVAQVIQQLSDRGAPWEQAFADPDRVLMALNHEMCDQNTLLKAGDELAFFPPVTGG